MADETKTVILEFQVDESDSIESINKLIAANKELRKERNELNIATEAGKKRAQEINSVIDANTQKIVSNSSALEKQKANIGNYGSATLKTNEILAGMSSRLSAIHPALGRVAVGMEAGVKGFSGLTMGARAFIATGIGAIIAALGLAFSALMKYFQGSEEGQNRLNRVVAIGTAIFEQLMNVVEAVGEVIFDAIENPQKAIKDFGNLIKDQIINRFTGMLELVPAIGKAVGLLFQGKFAEAAEVAGDAIGKVTLGVEDATEKIQGLITTTGDAVKTGIAFGEQIAALNAKIDKEERKLVEDRAKTNQEVSKLRQKSVELEGAARVRVIKEAIALEEQLAAREVELRKERLRLAELTVQAHGDDKEALNAVAQARAELTQAETAAYDNTLRFRKELKSATEEQIKLEQEAADDAEARRRAESGSAIGDVGDPTLELETKKAEGVIDIRKQLAKDIQRLDKEQAKRAEQNAEGQVKLEEMVAKQKYDAAFAVSNALLGLLDQQSSAYKAIATSQALVSTYTAATKAYEAAFLPIPTVASPALGVAFAAAAVLQGLGNVARINGVEFAEGGVVLRGPSHAQGGIPIVAEGNEIIMTKGVYNNPQLRAQASAINVAGGGRSFFADGGLVSNSISNPINQTADLTRAFQNIEIALDVTKVTKAQKEITVKQKISKRG